MHSTIKTFYNTAQVIPEDIAYLNYSKSPLKPKLLLEFLHKHQLDQYFEITDKFEPFSRSDFRIAHTDEYIDAFFNGEMPLCESNGLHWTTEFVNSVRYTNSSLYNAIVHSILNPEQISFSPTSGFHHAIPNSGRGFCTFSGQAIASIKIFNEFGYRGTYIDLDGHFGNSIEDTREFNPTINLAVPYGFNFNAYGMNQDYLDTLIHYLNALEYFIEDGIIDYIVWCHGADSHADDQLGHQCNTYYWTQCSIIFWNWLKKLNVKLGRDIPVTCALFGGYRDDDFDSVLSLHTFDLISSLNIMYDLNIEYYPTVLPNSNKL